MALSPPLSRGAECADWGSLLLPRASLPWSHASSETKFEVSEASCEEWRLSSGHHQSERNRCRVLKERGALLNSSLLIKDVGVSAFYSD